VKLLEFTAVRPLGKKVIQIVREYMSPEQYQRILGDKEKDAGFFRYSQEELFKAFDVVPVGSSITANKEVRSQQIQQAQGLLMGIDPQKSMNNPIQPYVVNDYEANRISLEDLDVKNVDDILVKLPKQPSPQPQGGMPPQGGQPPPMGIPFGA